MTLQAFSYSFFSTAVYLLNFDIHGPPPRFMNRMISVSIDEEAQVAYDSIPRGQRSLRIRELLKDAGALSVSEGEKVALRIEARLLRHELRRAELELQNFKTGMIEAGWISPEHQRESRRRGVSE